MNIQIAKIETPEVVVASAELIAERDALIAEFHVEYKKQKSAENRCFNIIGQFRQRPDLVLIDHSSFVEFCRDYLGVDQSYVGRAIKASIIKQYLLDNTTDHDEIETILRLRESHLRLLYIKLGFNWKTDKLGIEDESNLEAIRTLWVGTYNLIKTTTNREIDGSTTISKSLLESAFEQIVNHLNGTYTVEGRDVSVEELNEASQASGITPMQGQVMAMQLGLTESEYENLQRRKEKIKEKLGDTREWTSYRGVLSIEDGNVFITNQMNKYNVTSALLADVGKGITISIGRG